METPASTFCCEHCGEPAKVHVLTGYEGGKPVRYHLCLSCADADWRPGANRKAGRGERRLGYGALMVMAGVLVGGLAIAADYTGLQGESGFGNYQRAGVALGALLVIVGGLVRVDVLVLVGTLLFALALLSDVLKLKYQPGLGVKQQVVLGCAALLVTAGVFLRRRRAHRLEREPPHAS
jgi:hypothetical protein